MIRIVVAEDQAMVLGALAALLSLEDDLEVVGTAPSGAAALELAERLRPDVLVTDIEMPGMTGLELAAALLERQLPSRVVILTTFARTGDLRRAVDAGARGYLLKDAPAARRAEAIREVARGGKAIDPALAVEAWGEVDPLTPREREVLRLAGDGWSSADIGSALGLTSGTVRNYLSDAIAKLGAAGRVEAARLAREKGWL